MLERVAVILILFASLTAGDYSRWRSMGRKDILLYSLATGAALYVSVLFVTGRTSPNYSDLLKFVFGIPARYFGHMLKQS